MSRRTVAGLPEKSRPGTARAHGGGRHDRSLERLWLGGKVPLLVTIPAGVISPQFAVHAQWHTGTGILCPLQQVPCAPLMAEDVMKAFVHLVNTGHVGVMIEHEGETVLVDFPPLRLALREPPAKATEEEPPTNRIIVSGE